MRLWATIVAVAGAVTAAQMTNVNVLSGATLPSTCGVGAMFVRTSDAQVFVCGSTDAWSQMGGAAVPSGSILLIDTGTCPAGFSEVTGLNGRTLVGTLAANGNVGGTGGADAITPEGVNSAPIFSGTPFSSVINHTHAVNVTDPGHTHTQNSFAPRIINSGTAGTVGVQGASAASNANASNAATTATNQSATTGITATTSNPAGGVASITPAGTVSAPAFTGASFDNRSAYTRVIFCKKT